MQHVKDGFGVVATAAESLDVDLPPGSGWLFIFCVVLGSKQHLKKC